MTQQSQTVQPNDATKQVAVSGGNNGVQPQHFGTATAWGHMVSSTH